MFLCKWELDVVFGKQKEALEIIKAWGAEKMKSSHFSLSAQNRICTGFIGESTSHIADEYIFTSLNDFEQALSDMSKPQFKQFSEQIAPLIVPGSQKWVIFKVLE
jgi:hypothetical protein